MFNRIFPDFRRNRFESAETIFPSSSVHFDSVQANPDEPAETAHGPFLENRDTDIGLVHQQPLLHEFDSGAVAYLPEGYEPNYAYPLLVWLPEAAKTDTAEFGSIMSGISSRNFLGLQMPGWAEPPQNEKEMADAVRAQVTRMRQSWHVHTERIVLAGSRSAADQAVRVFLDRPEWFGGVIALFGTGGNRSSLRIPFRNPELKGKRLFLSTATQPPAKPVSEVFRMGRILNTAGMDVSTRVYDAGEESLPSVLTDINGWMIERLCVTV